MSMAYELARDSECPNRHGCVIYKKSYSVGMGVNKDKTHPAAVCYYSGCIHAEFAAIVASSKKDLKGAHLYVARAMRSKGEPIGISRPCRMCMKMIRAAEIKKIYYTTRDGNWTMERL